MNQKGVQNLVRKSKTNRLLWRRGEKEKVYPEENFLLVFMIINPNF